MTGRQRKGRWRYRGKGSLYPLVAGSIYHTTSMLHFCGIVESGAIVADAPVRAHPCVRPGFECQSQRTGTIALFDFRDVDRSCAVSQERHWAPFFCRHEARVILRLSASVVAPNLMPSSTPPTAEVDGTRFVPKWIPFVEAWHPGPIAFSAVMAVLLYDGWNNRGFDLLEPGPTLVKRVASRVDNYRRCYARRPKSFSERLAEAMRRTANA
ncbi:MAG: hypothetical protein SXG53_28655 [Pseudomonadota bacterium]|nr:hypothetical protein [Pseudomonadota bacterium]